MTYLQELDSARKITARTMKLLDTNHQAEVMVGVDLVVAYAFGIPRTVTVGGVLIDMDRNISTTLSLDGDHSKAKRFYLLEGLTSSSLEHDVFEKVLSDPSLTVQAISAIKALQVASTQGVPVHRIDQTNVSSLLPSLEVDAAIKTDIENAVNAGMTAIVSAQNIQLNDWNGAGYILLDPITGAGYYRISGGLGGGSLTEKLAELAQFVKAKQLAPRVVQGYIRNFRKIISIRSPVDGGHETSGWGPRSRNGGELHDGVDLSVPVGTSVYAIADGKAESKSNPGGFGLYIEIDHGLGAQGIQVFSLYGHLSSVVKTGDVKEGDLIGTSGSSGESTGPHLHFSIYIPNDQNPKIVPDPNASGRFIYNFEASVNPDEFIWTIPHD